MTIHLNATPYECLSPPTLFRYLKSFKLDFGALKSKVSQLIARLYVCQSVQKVFFG